MAPYGHCSGWLLRCCRQRDRAGFCQSSAPALRSAPRPPGTNNAGSTAVRDRRRPGGCLGSKTFHRWASGLRPSSGIPSTGAENDSTLPGTAACCPPDAPLLHRRPRAARRPAYPLTPPTLDAVHERRLGIGCVNGPAPDRGCVADQPQQPPPVPHASKHPTISARPPPSFHPPSNPSSDRQPPARRRS